MQRQNPKYLPVPPFFQISISPLLCLVQPRGTGHQAWSGTSPQLFSSAAPPPPAWSLHGLQSFRKNTCSLVVSLGAASSVRKTFLTWSSLQDVGNPCSGDCSTSSPLPSLALGLPRPISFCSSAYHGISLPCST